MKYLKSKKIIKLYNKLKKYRNFFYKIIDLIISPFALIAGKLGFYIVEIKTRSFGHHLMEMATYTCDDSINKKKLILLADKRKAYSPLASKLFNKLAIEVNQYNHLNPLYWFSRSELCGLSRIKEDQNKLEIIHKKVYDNRYNFELLNWDYFINNEINKNIFSKLNPNKKKFVIWKPRTKGGITNFRTTGIESLRKLIDYLNKKDVLVFAIFEDNISFKHPNLIDLNFIKEKEIKLSFIFYLDYFCQYAISASSGGAEPFRLLNKPLLVYDGGFPLCLYQGGLRTLIISKLYRSILTKNYLNVSQMIDFANFKLLSKFETIYNSGDEILNAFKELETKANLYEYEFPIDSYQIMNSWKSNKYFNTFNKYSFAQISDYWFLLNKDIFK